MALGIQVHYILGRRNLTYLSLQIEQVVLVIFALLVARSSALSLKDKQGLPTANQILAWSLSGGCMNT